MARSSRLVVPGCPHHVTQRGNRRQTVFFDDADYRDYIALMAESCAKAGTAVWAYCLMPNHVHMILVPKHEDGLRAAVSDTHRRYARRVNAREDWGGHLWQGRFASFPMDEAHLLACARYVELNPVRAKLHRSPRAWPWSSARAHLGGKDDALVSVAPLLDLVPDWKTFLAGGLDDAALGAIRGSERSGHPLGDAAFFKKLKRRFGRDVKPAKRGRPPHPKT